MRYSNVLMGKAGRFVIFCLSVLLMHSCSCKGDHGLDKKLEFVPDSCVVAMVVNVDEVLSQLDVSVEDGLELPSYMVSMLNEYAPSKSKAMLTKLADGLKGVAYDNVVIVSAGDDKASESMMVFGVDDEKEFVASLANLMNVSGTEKTDGYTVVGNDDLCVLVKDNLGFVAWNNREMVSASEAAVIIERFGEKGKENPLAAWKKDNLRGEGMVNGLVRKSFVGDDMADALPSGGYVAINVAGTDDSLKGSMRLLNDNGGKVSSPVKGQFNTEMLSYVGANDIFGASLCLNQDAYDRMCKVLPLYLKKMPTPVNDWLDMFMTWGRENFSDGGVFVSMGLSADVSVIDLLSNPYSASNYHIMIAASLKPEKASGAFDDICRSISPLAVDNASKNTDMPNQKTYRLRYETGYDYITGKYGYESVNVNIALKDNVLLISNGEIKKNDQNKFNAAVFSDNAGAVQMALPEKFDLLGMLGVDFGAEAYVAGNGVEFEAELKLNGAKDKVIPTILSVFMSN